YPSALVWQHLCFRRFQNFFTRRVHLIRHQMLVLANLVFDAEEWHAVSIGSRFVDHDPIFFSAKRFAIRMKRHQRRIMTADVLFKFLSKTRQWFRPSDGVLRAAAPELHSIAAQV